MQQEGKEAVQRRSRCPGPSRPDFNFRREETRLRQEAEKATAEKKPKAGKKLPKEAGAGAGDKKKKRTTKSVETYKI